jgi:hypothetical protein
VRPQVRLAGFLHKGMTDGEVRRVLGARPSGWVHEESQAGERWTHHYALLGLVVRYRVAEVAGERRTVLVVVGVEAAQP